MMSKSYNMQGLKTYNIEKGWPKNLKMKNQNLKTGKLAQKPEQNTKISQNLWARYEKNTKISKLSAFTLAEMLVVLTIITILAIMIWLAIDPIEQLRKAQDDAMLSNAKELAKAIERYHVSTYNFPWNVRNAAYTSAVRSEDKAYYYDPTLDTSDINWMWNLVDAGEIKEAAANRMIAAGYYIYKPATSGGSGDYAWVCFAPTSQQFMKQAATACNTRTGKTAPSRYRTFDPCQTDDGTVPDATTGLRNLLCVAE